MLDRSQNGRFQKMEVGSCHSDWSASPTAFDQVSPFLRDGANDRIRQKSPIERHKAAG